MTTYADEDELEEYLDATYEVPADAEKLLARASELIDYFSLNRALPAWDADEDLAEEDQLQRIALSRATCAQVEFWLEVGQTHDIAGLKGSLVAGRLQVHPVAGILAPRARRELANVGLYYVGVPAW